MADCACHDPNVKGAYTYLIGYNLCLWFYGRCMKIFKPWKCLTVTPPYVRRLEFQLPFWRSCLILWITITSYQVAWGPDPQCVQLTQVSSEDSWRQFATDRWLRLAKSIIHSATRSPSFKVSSVNQGGTILYDEGNFNSSSMTKKARLYNVIFPERSTIRDRFGLQPVRDWRT